MIGKSGVHTSGGGMAEQAVQTMNSLPLELLWDRQVGVSIVRVGGRNRAWDDVKEPVCLSPGDLDSIFRNGES